MTTYGTTQPPHPEVAQPSPTNASEVAAHASPDTVKPPQTEAVTIPLMLQNHQQPAVTPVTPDAQPQSVGAIAEPAILQPTSADANKLLQAHTDTVSA